jgi:NAD(P)-dependent dehydrogenase (short-subunit alcohol dehydrogenase family)
MNKLTGKVAIVTGASKGIGAAIAIALAQAGAKVAVNYSSARKERIALSRKSPATAERRLRFGRTSPKQTK